jgi:hypothetical protein
MDDADLEEVIIEINLSTIQQYSDWVSDRYEKLGLRSSNRKVLQEVPEVELEAAAPADRMTRSSKSRPTE